MPLPMHGGEQHEGRRWCSGNGIGGHHDCVREQREEGSNVVRSWQRQGEVNGVGGHVRSEQTVRGTGKMGLVHCGYHATPLLLPKWHANDALANLAIQ